MRHPHELRRLCVTSKSSPFGLAGVTRRHWLLLLLLKLLKLVVVLLLVVSVLAGDALRDRLF